MNIVEAITYDGQRQRQHKMVSLFDYRVLYPLWYHISSSKYKDCFRKLNATRLLHQCIAIHFVQTHSTIQSSLYGMIKTTGLSTNTLDLHTLNEGINKYAAFVLIFSWKKRQKLVKQTLFFCRQRVFPGFGVPSHTHTNTQRTSESARDVLHLCYSFVVLCAACWLKGICTCCIAAPNKYLIGTHLHPAVLCVKLCYTMFISYGHTSTQAQAPSHIKWRQPRYMFVTHRLNSNENILLSPNFA